MFKKQISTNSFFKNIRTDDKEDIMHKSFTRYYNKININNHKLQQFNYCNFSFCGDIHELMAEELTQNYKILSYLRDQDQDSIDFLKNIIKEKLERLKNSSKRSGYVKNDGIFMNFLSFEALKELYDVMPLYLLQRSDIEKAKFGIDSIFYRNNDIWIFEFKTSINQLDESSTAIRIYEGVESLFCKGDIKIASLYDCNTTIKKNRLDPSLYNVINNFIDNRNDIKTLLMFVIMIEPLDKQSAAFVHCS
ncbi:MAG TPA: hypothetical protein VIL26_02010 [Clostridia bacterium]